MDLFPKRSDMPAPAASTEPEWRSEPASPEQRRTIASLRDTKDDTGMGPTPDDLTKGKASDAIDWLLKRPIKPVAHKPPGDYLLDDKIYRLRTTLDGKRQYVQLVHPNGRTEYAPGLTFKVLKEGVPVADTPLPAPAIPLLSPGFYETDGQVYRVVESEDTGRIYVLKLDMDNLRKGEKMHWLPRLITLRQLSDLDPNQITIAKVKELGDITEYCVFCNRQLSDDRSTEAGYGPRCAAKYNLPWGE